MDELGAGTTEICQWKWVASDAGKPGSTAQAPERIFTMLTIPSKSETEPAHPKPANANSPGIASELVPDALATLHVNPDTGLTLAEVDERRKEHGDNEVAEKKGHPALKFLRKTGGRKPWSSRAVSGSAS